MSARVPVLTYNFGLVCATTFLVTIAQFLVLTAIPLLLTELDFSRQFIGMFVGAFALGAMVVRIPIGSAVDRYNSRPFRIAGATLFGLACMLYIIAREQPENFALLAGIPIMLVAADLIHSIGFGTYGTAAHALVGYIAPETRRGETLAYYGILINLARGGAAGVSLLVVRELGYSVLFLIASAFSFTATVLSFLIEDPPHPAELDVHPTRRLRLETTVLAPAFANMTLALINGGVLGFVILLGIERGLVNPGIFFTMSALASIGTRFLAGRVADEYGRLAAIIPGMLLTSASLYCLAQTYTMPVMMLAGILHGIGTSSANSAFQALAIDMAPPVRVGAAMATFFMMVDLGISLGSIATGQIAANMPYGEVFSLSTLIPLMGLAGFLIYFRQHGSRDKVPTM